MKKKFFLENISGLREKWKSNFHEAKCKQFSILIVNEFTAVMRGPLSVLT